MKEHILVIDAGNTSTALALYCHKRVSRIFWQATSVRSRARLEKAVRDVVRDHNIRGAVLGSVVPSVNKGWQSAVKKVCGVIPLKVSHRLNIGIPISYPAPAKIGADRLANACGAADRYGTPVIVADFGTALTFDVVASRKGYTGGVIAPGLPLMYDYLAEKTALLPHVKPAAVRRAVGKSTAEAIQIGTRWGYLGMVREILNRIEKELRKKEITVCATGGYASWILQGLKKPVIIDRDLTLYGFGRIYDLNNSD